jgi:hypothetical protein
MHGNAKKGLDDNLPIQLMVVFFFANLFQGGFFKNIDIFLF